MHGKSAGFESPYLQQLSLDNSLFSFSRSHENTSQTSSRITSSPSSLINIFSLFKLSISFFRCSKSSIINLSDLKVDLFIGLYLRCLSIVSEKSDLAFFHTYGRIETVLLIYGVDLAVIKNSVHYILLLGSRPAASGRAGSRIRSFQPEPVKMLSGHKFLQTVRSRRRSQEHA